MDWFGGGSGKEFSWETFGMRLLAGFANLYTGMQQRKAAASTEELGREQQAMAYRNAVREEQESAEQQRRLADQQAKGEAMARASAAGSGFAYGGLQGADSIALALSEQKKENTAQLDWEKTAGKSRADIIRESGDFASRKAGVEAQGMRASATGNYINAAGNFFSAGTRAYDWWKPKTTGSPRQTPNSRELDV